MEPVSLEDERAIAFQLDRQPRGLLGVERRCRYGYPQVVSVHPLVEGKPFPTLFWLTCPFLVQAVDRLEGEGWVKRMEDLLEKDASLARSLAEAHRRYITEREALLSPRDRALLEENGMLESLLTKGIGGTADFRHVKCLHLHTAHALTRGNPIGERALALLAETVCPPSKKICSAHEGRSRPANDRRV